MSPKPSVFISYSHLDKNWLERLRVQLKVLADRIDIFTDNDIETGTLWETAILEKLHSCDIAVLMVSPDFLASDYIMDKEVPLILDRVARGSVRLVWIPVRESLVDETNIIDYQAAWNVKNPLAELPEAKVDAALKKIAKEITRQKPLAVTGERGKPRTQVARMPASGAGLFGRERELAALDAAWTDAKTRIFSLVAFGGVGKTALVNRWLARMADDGWRGARRVYTWSFYSQGGGEDRQATGEAFLGDALKWFGDADPEEGDAFAKASRLADLIAAESTLLVLDGLEPLQYVAEGIRGRLKDTGIKTLLRQLALESNGLCLLTTRLPVTDLDHHDGEALKRIDLEALGIGAGTQLLRFRNSRGLEADFRATVEEFGGHALALTLLANYLEAYDGDLRSRDRLPPLEKEPGKGGHATRVLKGYEDALEPAETSLLMLVGLFDRPAEPAALAALLEEPVIEGLTEPLISLDQTEMALLRTRLTRNGLLAPTKVGQPLDAHPLVREHFGTRLEHEAPEAWRQAHDRLYEHYRGQPEKEQPDTLAEMEPLFRAVHHGCRAGRVQEAMGEVYWSRILRKNAGFIFYQLGAYGSDLATLASFFAEPWTTPDPLLAPDNQAVVLSWAGFRLRALGRLSEATQATESGHALYVGQENWKNASIVAGNLSEMWLARGNVAAAVRWAEKAVTHADQSEESFQKMANRNTLADAYHQAGDRDRAAALFAEAETLQKQQQPEYPLLYSIWGFRYCELLLAEGKWQEVCERAEKALTYPEKYLLCTGLGELSLGRAAHAAWRVGEGSAEEAENASSRALASLRRASTMNHLPRGLLARAAFLRETGRLEEANRDLAEARELVELGEMRLFLVDILLEEARLADARNDATTARAKYIEARDLIDETGYHRRDAELPAGLRK